MSRDKRSYLRKQCEKFPDRLSNHRQLAELLSADGLFNEAAGLYQHCLKLSQKDARLWYQLGVCYRRLSMLNEAIDAFRQAIREAPRYARAFRQLGICMLELELPADAADFFEAAMILSPRIEGTRLHLAQAYERLEWYDDALAQYQQEHIDKPQNWKIRWRQAQCYLKVGNLFESYRILQEIFPCTRNHPDGDEVRDLLHHVRKQIQAANQVEDLSPLENELSDRSDQELEPVESETIDSTSESVSATDTLRQLQRAVLMEPENPQLRVSLAEAHAERKQWQAALDSYRRAFQLISPLDSEEKFSE